MLTEWWFWLLVVPGVTAAITGCAVYASAHREHDAPDWHAGNYRDEDQPPDETLRKYRGWN